MRYNTLNDAAYHLGFAELLPGDTEVWYSRKPGFADNVDLNFRDTHVLLGKVASKDRELLFRILQGENWSPEGEAREFIVARKLFHTSMSVGDVLVVDGIAYVCDMVGWVEL